MHTISEGHRHLVNEKIDERFASKYVWIATRRFAKQWNSSDILESGFGTVLPNHVPANAHNIDREDIVMLPTRNSTNGPHQSMFGSHIVCVDTISCVWSAVYQYLKYTRNRHFARMKKNVLRDAPVEEQQVIAAHSKGSSPFVGEAAVKYLTRQTSFIKLWREIRHVNYAANVIMFCETVERFGYF